MTTFIPVVTPRAPWPSLPAPRIKSIIPCISFRAIRSACRAVDRDIEQVGTVSWETVEQVRAALALVRSLPPTY